MKVRIGTKFLLGNLSIVLLLIVMFFVGTNSLKTMENNTRVTDANVNVLIKSDNLRYFILMESYSVRGYMLTGNEKYIADFNSARQETLKIVDELKKAQLSENEKQNLTKFENLNTEYYDIADKALLLTKQGKTKEAAVYVTKASGVMAEIQKISNEWTNINHDKVSENLTTSVNTGENARILFLIVTLVSVAAGIILSIVIGRLISGPIQKITRVAEQLSEGDLTVTVPDIKSRDEVEILSKAFSHMIENLRSLILSIGQSAEYVASTSSELFANAEQTSEASTQVAKAIEEVATGTTDQSESVSEAVKMVDQVAQAVEQIASGAQEQSRNVVVTTELVEDMKEKIDVMVGAVGQIKEDSQQNGQIAKDGGRAVEQTVLGMERVKDAVFETANRIRELGDQSQQIGDIIQVIDDIAEQTNLLALNAAIEAARAGEHGKGFAVVADEVRKLAERSGKATKEIAELIINIQKGTDTAVQSMEIGTREVEEGVDIARTAGESLGKIVNVVEKTGKEIEGLMEIIQQVLERSGLVSEAVNNVAAITEENTAATQQMAASTQQVRFTMDSMAAVTEQSAASAEEVSASTEEITASTEEIANSAEKLSKMAAQLQEYVKRFKV